MNWWNVFANRIELDAPLDRLTWFRVGGRAKYLFHPRDADDLALMVERARGEDIPIRMLGGGANVLVGDDGFDGVVVRLDADPFRTIRRKNGSVTVGAGVDLMPLSRTCSEQGLAGLECMAGIPATVGGAVRMNAGGRFGQFGDVVQSVDVMTPEGHLETWPRESVGFAYRRTALGERIVLTARLELIEDDPQVTGRRYEELFRLKQDTQPLADRSAGCIFKNPPGQSAGALIERAGLKGASHGQAHVSTRHANFIVTGRGATASDVLFLIDRIRDRVDERFSVALETEIDIWRPIANQDPIPCR